MVFASGDIAENQSRRNRRRGRVGTVAYPYEEMAGIRLDAGGLGMYYGY